MFKKIVILLLISYGLYAKSFNLSEFEVVSSGIENNNTISFKRKSENKDVYIAMYKLNKEQNITKVSAKVYLEGFDKIDYLAFGIYKDKKYLHIKVKHPIQKNYTYLDFDIHSLAYRLSNKYKIEQIDSIKTNNIRLFVKGLASVSGATMKLKDISFHNNKELVKVDNKHFKNMTTKEMVQLIPSDKLQNFLLEYDKNTFPKWLDNAKLYLEQKGIVLSKKHKLSYPKFTQDVKKLASTNISLRYSYHALHHVNFLLMNSESNDDISSYMAARSLVDEWLGGGVL